MKMKKMKTSRFPICCSLGWLALASLASHAGADRAAEGIAGAGTAARPNVLVILADDLGYSDLGCYGSKIRTPNLDSLAEHGIRFTDFYNTARCWPTRAALLTGYYPQQIHFDAIPANKKLGLPAVKTSRRRPVWAPLLPDLIRAAGYRSYHSGKWHLDRAPIATGFDASYLLKDQGRFFSPKVHYLDDVRLPEVSRDEGYYATTAVVDHAVETLASHAEKHTGQPFFYFLAFAAPHFPLQALPEDIAKYDGVFDDGWDVARERRFGRLQRDGLIKGVLPDIEPDVGPPYHFPEQIAMYGPGEIDHPVPWGELTTIQKKFQSTKMAIHAAMIDRMDQEIGRVLGQLKSMNAFDDTLILFLSDNGGSAELMVRADGHDPNAPMGSADTHLCLGPGWSTAANTPYRRHKTWVHEGGCHTPLIAHWPAVIDQDTGVGSQGLNRSLGHVIDLAPTILELAGVASPDEFSGVDRPSLPGRSFAAALRGETLPPRTLWWCHEDNRAYRDGDWKLVAAAGRPWELYDLSVDPTEVNDLAAADPERVTEMAAAWQTQADAMRD